MSRVFVVQEPLKKRGDRFERKFDIRPAAVYGEIVPLLEPGMTPMTPGPVVTQLFKGLRDFSDDDYLLPIGPPAMIGYATAVAAQMNPTGRVTMLEWDKRLSCYIKNPPAKLK